MTRIVLTEFVSLDGVMEEPRWTSGFERGPDGIAFKSEAKPDRDGVMLLRYRPAAAGEER